MPSKQHSQPSEQPTHLQPLPEGRALQRSRWGIFEVAYEHPKRQCSFLTAVSSLPALPRSAPFAMRLVLKLFTLAPFTLAIYGLGCIWSMTSAVLSLYMASIALDLISTPSPCLEGFEAMSSGPLATLVYSCIASTLMSTLLERLKKEASMNLRGELRSYFLPKLAKARLEMMKPDSDALFPGPWQFEEVAPGWDIIESLCFRVGSLCIVVIQGMILVLLYWKKRTLEIELLLVFCVYYPISLHAMPSNQIGGVEYTFWTRNPYYQRLASLYSIVFSAKYQKDIRKDGIARLLATEYAETSNQLDNHRPDAMRLASNDIPRPLLWDMINSVVADLPVLAFVLTLPWSVPTNSIAKSLLLRLMTELIRNNFDLCLQSKLSLGSLCAQAEKFYIPLDDELSPHHEDVYSDHVTGRVEGMKLTLSDADLVLGSPQRTILRQVSFNIQPGQVVAIVGPNGSGKSTLLNLLSGLVGPSNGKVFVDDQPIVASNISALRCHTTMLAQTPQELYPVSLRENIAFGAMRHSSDTIDQAAKLGGAYDLLLRVGYDATPSAIPALGQSMGVSPQAAVAARNIALLPRRPVQLTREEVQRVLASRACFRLLCNESRLVLIDDALSELDPLAEMNVLSNIISLSEGKTVVYVAHRMSQIITQADLIICMREGAVVETGTHQELIQAHGGYAALYSAIA